MTTNFDYLYQHLSEIDKIQLPADTPNQDMSPPERRKLIENIDFNQVKPKESAVMAVLFPVENETHVLFIERATYEGVHSGQIAFPGGKREPEDADLYQTALRETNEEVGILPEQLQLVKTLTPVYVPPSNFMIHPFVSVHTQSLKVRLDEVEVHASLCISLADLMNPEHIKHIERQTSYGKYKDVPAYVINGKVIWGATAMIVEEMLNLLRQN